MIAGLGHPSKRGRSTSGGFDMGNIFTIMHSKECTLITSQFDTLAKWFSYGTIVTRFSYQRVNCFCLCPAWKEKSGTLETWFLPQCDFLICILANVVVSTLTLRKKMQAEKLHRRNIQKAWERINKGAKRLGTLARYKERKWVQMKSSVLKGSGSTTTN